MLEIGSGGNEFGFNKLHLKSLHPLSYVGTDIVASSGVDTVCHICELENKYGPDSFDVIVSTEVMEHIRDWKSAIHQIKTVLRPCGIIVLTTRSLGYPYHRGTSGDFWRFEQDEMGRIFDDFNILALQRDLGTMPGVFIFAAKPESGNFQENDLSEIALYSMLTRKKTRSVSMWEQQLDNFRYKHGQQVMKVIGTTILRRLKRMMGWS